MTVVGTTPAAPPVLAWPTAVTAEQAVAKVARRLRGPGGLTARLYHHPFLGLTFLGGSTAPRWRGGAASAPVLAPVVVDLVSGRAFLSDPWEEDSFTTCREALEAAGDDGSAPVRGPRPRVSPSEAVEAARALLAGVLVRRRRLGGLGPVALSGTPVSFGKPNWWVTGELHGRPVEVVVDALSGRHYASTA